MPNITTYTDAQVLELINSVIGSTYSEELRQQVEQTTGRPTRPWGNYVATYDSRAERINLNVNADERIISIYFG
ncbi:hypothetical protein [Pseudomonas sp. HS6]|uniref:hypothetical protein n=1 Tax=Pseudomonas sp. HS6 TaxID=2850559 RepID=UPI002019ED5F|nr:hypothetical protein [Pseudomonas sp. HS6]UQS13349.1 hypothetical protein JJN09_19250 [Pseudomonas sp. HS6]